MKAILTGVLVFSLSFGGAIFGMALSRMLPAHHKDEATKDAIKVATAVVATLAALVVGLLISSAKESFDAKDDAIKSVARNVVLLDRALLDYGPETRPARNLLRETIEHAVVAIWGEEDGPLKQDAISAGTGMASLERLLFALAPQSDTQKWLKTSALRHVSEIETLRLKAIAQKDGNIRWPFVAVLTFWFVILFLSFGLFAPGNASVYVVLATSALSVAAALYLIVQMDRPYSGFIEISSAPLREVLAQMPR